MKKIVIALLAVVLLAGLMPAGLSLAEDTYATVYSGNEFGVRLREGPATTYGIELILPSGTTVTVLETGTVWTRIQAGTRTGYMMSKFLVAGGTSSGVTIVNTATVYANNGLRTWLRSAPDGRRLGLYSDGTPVNILEHGDTWCRVMIGSSVGYMMTRYLVMTPGPAPTPVPAFVPLTAVTVNYPYPLVGDTLLPVTTPAGATVSCVWEWADLDAAGKAVYTSRSTNSSYAVSAADAGHMIRLTVTGTGAYAGVSFSCTTDPVTASKAITGVMIKNTATAHSVPVAGDVLTSIVAPSSATVTYSWRVAGVEKGTEASYTVAAADVGKTIQVYVTGTGSFTGSASSEATSAVANANTIVSVKLSTQYPVVGSAVSAVLTPSNATASYIWYVNGAPIATSGTYTPNNFDLGDVLSVKVAGTGSFTGNAASADSEPISRTLLTGVTISNTNPSLGATLKAAVAPAAAQDDNSVKYQWYRVSASATEITGATSKEYTVAAEDIGMKLYVVATGDGVYGGKVTSATTALAVTSPVLTGVTLDVSNPVVGDTITAKLTPTLNATDLAKCTFIWQIGSSRFVGGQSYTVGNSDVGYQIRVQVNPGGGDVVTSAATAAVVTTSKLTGIGLYTTYTEASKVGLNGAPVVGQTLIAKVKPVQADSKVTYVWTVGGVIVGKGDAYTVVENDMGKQITVTASDSGTGAYTEKVSATTSAVPKTAGQQIDLKNALTPVAGAMPVYKVNGTFTDKSTYSASISWSPALATNGTFKSKETYTAKLTFSFSSSAYRLGTVLNAGTSNVSYTGNVATCEYAPLVDSQIITNLNIAGLTAPVVGAVPDDTVNGCSQYKGGTVLWTPNDDKFAVGQSYTATIPLTAEDGYTFLGLADKSSSTFTVLGATSTFFTIADGGAKATVTATFPTTAKNTSATVSASRTTVPVGSSRKYVQCEASLVNYPGDQSGVSWKWELSGAASSDTAIDANGLVTVALDEVAGRTLTVSATTQNVKNLDGKAYSATLTITTATEAAVTGTEAVSIISAPNEIAVGASGTFAAEVVNANNEVVIWSVSGVDGTKNAATKINGDGVLTISADETVKQLAVTARSVNGATSTCYVTVVYTTAPVGVAFNDGQKSVKCGKSATFRVAVVQSAAPVSPKLTFSAKVDNVSDASTVITLSSYVIDPFNAATADVTVNVTDDASMVGKEVWVSAVYSEGGNEYKDIWSFIIVAGEESSTAYNLNVTPGTGTVILGKAAAAQAFTATASPAVDGSTIEWTVTKGDTLITLSPTAGTGTTLTVNADVTKNEEAEITVKYIDTLGKVKNPGDVLKSTTIALTLTPAGGDKTQLFISPSAVPTLAKGDQVTLSAVYGDGTIADGATWASSDAAIAKVDASGVVEALKAGTVTITATKGSLTKTVDVTVAPSLSIKSNAINAKPGETMGITADFDGTGDLDWTASNDEAVESITGTAADAAVKLKATAPNGASVTVTATSKANPALSSSCTFKVVAGRTLTVTGGKASTPKSGSGNVYEKDELVTINATIPTDSTFEKWTGLGSAVIVSGDPAKDSAISFKMPDESLNVVANFKTSYKVTVTNGTAGKATYTEGETVTITANGAATNTAFTGWSTSDIATPTVDGSDPLKATFTMPAKNVGITATYANTYLLKVVNGTPTGNRYVAGKTIGITAGADPKGGVFLRWSVANAAIADAAQNPGLLTMGTSDATATPVYGYTLTVTNGNGGGTYEKGKAVTIVATPPDGEKFDKWVVTGATLSGNSASATITMGEANASAEAFFVPIVP